MKIISVNINGTNIRFDNCMWTGYESIFVNGELVSKKFSWFGMDHSFEVEEDGEWVDYVLTTGIGWSGVTTKITRDGIIVLDSSNVGKHFDLGISSGGSVMYNERDFV